MRGDGRFLTPGEWLDAFLAMPAQIAELREIIVAIGEQTAAALTELRAAIDEVATELNDLAGKVTAGQTSDAEVAAALSASAQRLRDLRPDTPAAPTP